MLFTIVGRVFFIRDIQNHIQISQYLSSQQWGPSSLSLCPSALWLSHLKGSMLVQPIATGWPFRIITSVNSPLEMESCWVFSGHLFHFTSCSSSPQCHWSSSAWFPAEASSCFQWQILLCAPHPARPGMPPPHHHTHTHTPLPIIHSGNHTYKCHLFPFSASNKDTAVGNKNL